MRMNRRRPWPADGSAYTSIEDVGQILGVSRATAHRRMAAAVDHAAGRKSS